MRFHGIGTGIGIDNSVSEPESEKWYRNRNRNRKNGIGTGIGKMVSVHHYLVLPLILKLTPALFFSLSMLIFKSQMES